MLLKFFSQIFFTWRDVSEIFIANCHFHQVRSRLVRSCLWLQGISFQNWNPNSYFWIYILVLTLIQEDESNCVDPASGLICAGHGQCVCGVRLPSTFLIWHQAWSIALNFYFCIDVESISWLHHDLTFWRLASARTTATQGRTAPSVQFARISVRAWGWPPFQWSSFKLVGCPPW